MRYVRSWWLGPATLSHLFPSAFLKFYLFDFDNTFEPMTTPSEYHLFELAIVNSPDDPRRNLPTDVEPGSRVLDVGCGIGQSLMATDFAGCARHGVDIDANAIAAGNEMFPDLDLKVSRAEKLPYVDSSFDLVYSRVAIPYTDVPLALREIVRVAKPGGRVWLSLHPWSMERREIFGAFRSLSVRRIVDRAYVAGNSLLLAAIGRCFARPWSGQYESFQFPARTRAMLLDLGCEAVTTGTDQFFVVEARKKI